MNKNIKLISFVKQKVHRKPKAVRYADDQEVQKYFHQVVSAYKESLKLLASR